MWSALWSPEKAVDVWKDEVVIVVHEERNDLEESWGGKGFKHIEVLLVARGPARI